MSIRITLKRGNKRKTVTLKNPKGESAKGPYRMHTCSQCKHQWLTKAVPAKGFTPNISGEATPWCPLCHRRASESSAHIYVEKEKLS